MVGISDCLGIKYKLDKSDKFDEFMKAIGVGMITRKMGNSVSPVVELTENGGTYTLTSNSTFKNTTTVFKIGEEFEEDTPDGRKVKSVITKDGDNKLFHVQKGEKESTILREFNKDECIMTLKVDDIVCTRVYKAVQ